MSYWCVLFPLNPVFSALIFCWNSPWLSVILSQRVCYAVYFHEEIENSVTVIIYFLNDNLLAKSLSVIAKSPAWLVGETAYTLKALMRWTKMRFGGVACGGSCSQRCVHYALHAINFSFEVSGVFSLRCASERKNIYLLLVFCDCFPVCVFECVPLHDASCLLCVCVCGNSFECGYNSSACATWTLHVCVRLGGCVCVC